jgi:hypothetical protein
VSLSVECNYADYLTWDLFKVLDYGLYEVPPRMPGSAPPPGIRSPEGGTGGSTNRSMRGAPFALGSVSNLLPMGAHRRSRSKSSSESYAGRSNSLFSSSTAGGHTSTAPTSIVSGSYESRNNSHSVKTKKMADVEEMEEVLEETTSVSTKTTSTRPKYKSSADDVFCAWLSALSPLYLCAHLNLGVWAQ